MPRIENAIVSVAEQHNGSLSSLHSMSDDHISTARFDLTPTSVLAKHVKQFNQRVVKDGK